MGRIGVSFPGKRASLSPLLKVAVMGRIPVSFPRQKRQTFAFAKGCRDVARI